MRKIDKTCCYSTKYYDWLSEIELAKEIHRPSGTKFKFYWDVAMNLFYCQKGLCAYTEKRVCPSKYFEAANWENGKYKKVNYNPKKPEVDADVEHFDSSKKTDKEWLWSNLFMAQSSVNSRGKGTMQTHQFYKPDEKGYNEFALFEDDATMHIFKANKKLSTAKKKKLNLFIDAVINYDTIIDDRRIFFTALLKNIELGEASWNDKVEQFPTAFQLIKRQKGN